MQNDLLIFCHRIRAQLLPRSLWGQAKYPLCWSGSEQVPAVHTPQAGDGPSVGMGLLWQHMEHSPGMTCSEGLCVSQRGAQGWADSATMSGGLSSVLLDLRFAI